VSIEASKAVVLSSASVGSWTVARAIVETTKPRIVRLVTITSGVGFGLAAVGRGWSWIELAIASSGCVAGTALSAAGANALNQWSERERDARMPRTCSRPLPQERLRPDTALLAGLVLGVLGVGVLWWACGIVAAAVSLATILTYLLAYTPLKPVTPLATIVGAVPGALPPLIGWAAGRPELGWDALAMPGAWSLFLLMFVWQIPHFLAIAWLYRDDYEKGGYAVMPVLDPDGRQTSRTILLWSILFVPISMSPSILIRDQPGPGVFYAIVAGVTGLLLVAMSLRLVRVRTRELARRMFIASVMHLPLLMGVLLIDSVIALITRAE
jgi:heme o synthase